MPHRLEKQWVLWSAEAGLQSQVNLQSLLWSPRPEAPLWRSWEARPSYLSQIQTEKGMVGNGKGGVGTVFLSWVGWRCAGSGSASKSSKVTQEGVLEPLVTRHWSFKPGLLSLAQKLTTKEN